jgi:hypothetical protein
VWSQARIYIYNRSMDMRWVCMRQYRKGNNVSNERSSVVRLYIAQLCRPYMCARDSFFRCVCAVADTKCDLLLSFTHCPLLLSSLPSPAGFLEDVKNAVVILIYFQIVCQVPGCIPKSHISYSKSPFSPYTNYEC